MVSSLCLSTILGEVGEKRGNYLHLRVNAPLTKGITLSMSLITAPISCVQSGWPNGVWLIWSTIGDANKAIEYDYNESISCSFQGECYSTKSMLRGLMYASDSLTSFRGSVYRTKGCSEMCL